MKDVMTVIASDAARRHSFTGLAHKLAESCTDADLRQAAIAWLTIMEAAE